MTPLEKQIIINSLSGGKTSGYIGMHYKADYNLFSLVCIDDIKCGHPDNFFMKYANDKLSKYCKDYGEVIGTAEDPIIFQTMYELEQLMGQEIIWLRGVSFDKLIDIKKGLPGKAKGTLGRFCTTWLKIAPAFEFWYKYLAPEKIKVNLGFRYDEQERTDTFSTTWDFPVSTNNYGCHRNNWVKGLEWREGRFPLIEDRIFHKDIIDYWQDKSIHFAKDSNCQFCIFKKIQQIKMNSINCPDQINWAESKEEKHTWHKYSIKDAKKYIIDPEFNYGTGAGCTAGECIS